jgi:ATP-dependent exoDNAse (exonuclease V) beta subunit
MRLLYVAATRAEDRLILSGATEELAALNRANDSWLKWIWQALELEGRTQTQIVDLAKDVQLQLTMNLADEPLPPVALEAEEALEPGPPGESLGQVFPLLRPVIATAGSSIHRFSVTQLINYQRCPRQYYFERVLRLPAADELAIWNNAEAPEPPSNINATLKGAVIHRFCERYTPDQDSEDLLRQSFADVLRLRQAQLSDRLIEINPEAAIKDLLPLAKNYLASDVFKRVEAARKQSAGRPAGEAGLWSELSFRLRRPLGILSGIIDKLLITQTPEGWFEAEIIDFKTNRIRVDVPPVVYEAPARKQSSKTGQFAFEFETEPAPAPPLDAATNNIIEITARDYQLQMQAYAHAVRRLVPSLANSKIRVTLHFLDPNVESHLSDELLEPARCARAIDEAMMRIVTSGNPSHFPVKTAPHCRMCNFLRVCTAGREYLR